MPKTLADILTKYFPKNTYPVLSDVINSHEFSFKATKNRTSKLGDFRVRQGHLPLITVNGTLNSYSFLITFLHELAHLAAHLKFGRGIKPHGYEWKSQFQEYLLICIKNNIFPDDLLTHLLLFTNNPKASTSASPDLMKALAKYDCNSNKTVDTLYLDDILIDHFFIFRGETYKKLDKRRTRALCERLSNKKRYTISGHAEVTLQKDI